MPLILAALPEHQASLDSACAGFGLSASKGMANDNLELVAKAAAEGKIDTIVIESNRQNAGSFDNRASQIN